MKTLGKGYNRNFFVSRVLRAWATYPIKTKSGLAHCGGLGEEEAMPPLRATARENAIGRLQAGQRQVDVARALNVSQGTISRLWTRFQQTGSTADAPRSGRPRVTTPAQDRFIRLRHLRNRFLTAQSTVNALPGNRRISRQTVRNRLHQAGLRAYRPVRGNVLTRRHRQDRLLWANQHRAWTLRAHWQHVWFSDESRFLLQRHDRRRRVYRRSGERYAPQCVDEAPPHGGGGVTVWGAISNTGRSQLVRVQGNLTAAQYVQDILRPHVHPLMATPRALFQHDNARPHTARVTVAYLNDQNIRRLPWPSLSPDLNPIEHLWDELDRRLRASANPPATANELFAQLQQEWDAIPRQTIQHLIASMPRRCQAVIQANGGHNQY